MLTQLAHGIVPLFSVLCRRGGNWLLRSAHRCLLRETFPVDSVQSQCATAWPVVMHALHLLPHHSFRARHTGLLCHWTAVLLSDSGIFVVLSFVSGSQQGELALLCRR